MIIDTSVLDAVLRREEDRGPILDALARANNLLRAFIIVEFARVAARQVNAPMPN